MKALEELVSTVKDFTPAQVMRALVMDLSDKIINAADERCFTAKYIAMDADGAVFVYAKKPIAIDGHFIALPMYELACIDAFEAGFIIGEVEDYKNYILEL